jgi:hypothetical protein
MVCHRHSRKAQLPRWLHFLWWPGPLQALHSSQNYHSLSANNIFRSPQYCWNPIGTAWLCSYATRSSSQLRQNPPAERNLQLSFVFSLHFSLLVSRTMSYTNLNAWIQHQWEPGWYSWYHTLLGFLWNPSNKLFVVWARELSSGRWANKQANH